MRLPVTENEFLTFFPPYRTVEPFQPGASFPGGPFPIRGGAIIWNMRGALRTSCFPQIRSRPSGVALVVLLPPSTALGDSSILFELMTRCRPHSVLPHQEDIDTDELAAVLRRTPSELAVEVSDYLTWRGLDVDLDTRRLIRKTLDLSDELRTVGGLARALYMSRRALGRRFLTRGLPVPSHWLHFGRVLRASILLQSPDTTVTNAARALGYPDGFALSNQMKRLTGLRPSIMRECFGWEWIVEAWLRVEATQEELPKPLRKTLAPWRSPDPDRGQWHQSARRAVGNQGLRVGESRPAPGATGMGCFPAEDEDD
jgi:AraC-like DNA-binding protein